MDMSHFLLQLDRKHEEMNKMTQQRSRRSARDACTCLLFSYICSCFPCSVQLFLFWQSAPGRDRDVFMLRQGPHCYTTYQISRDLQVPIQLMGDLGLLVFINLRLLIAREIQVYNLDHINSL